MKNFLSIICCLFLAATTVKADPAYPTSPTRQEVCDYINDQLKGHFDSSFEELAKNIKSQYALQYEVFCFLPYWTAWLANDLVVKYDAIPQEGSGGDNLCPDYASGGTIFDVCDDVVKDILEWTGCGNSPRFDYSEAFFAASNGEKIIQFSSWQHENSFPSLSVTASLVNNDTGLMRDTYNWNLFHVILHCYQH